MRNEAYRVEVLKGSGLFHHENRLREQRRFKGSVRILLQPPRVHRFLDCFHGGLARVDSRPARLRSFLNRRYGRTPAVPPF